MKQIIVLVLNPNQGGIVSIDTLFWFSVPIGRRIPLDAANSPFTKALPEELNAINDGSVLQEQHAFALPASYTEVQLAAILQRFYADRGAWLAAQTSQGQYFGLTWDGTAWTRV